MTFFWTSLVVAFAIGFYWLRCQIKLVFGLIEVIVALLVIYFSINPANHALLASPAASDLEILLSSSTVLLGGVYIFVRGLDNIGQKLPKPSGLQRWWHRWFLAPWPCAKRVERLIAEWLHSK